MARSIVKGLFVYPFFRRAGEVVLRGESIYFWRKDKVLSEFMLDADCWLHNGKQFVRLGITSDRVGFRLGEFLMTTRFGPAIHLVDKKKRKKNRKGTR